MTVSRSVLSLPFECLCSVIDVLMVVLSSQQHRCPCRWINRDLKLRNFSTFLKPIKKTPMSIPRVNAKALAVVKKVAHLRVKDRKPRVVKFVREMQLD